MRREQYCTLSPFLFAQRVPGARLDCFLFPSAIYGDFVYSREFLLKSFLPGDFLTFICFYAAEVKESHVVSFFSPHLKKKKRQEENNFPCKIRPNPKTTAFSTKKQTRAKNKRALELEVQRCQPTPSVSFSLINRVYKNALGEKVQNFFFNVVKIQCCLGGIVLHSIHTLPN